MNPLTQQDVQNAVLGQTIERLATITVTSGSADEGAYVQLDASTATEVKGLVICLYNPNANELYEVEIAVGASGSEVALIDDLVHYGNGDPQGRIYSFPVEVAAGLRLAARVQATTNTSTIRVAVWLVRS